MYAGWECLYFFKDDFSGCKKVVTDGHQFPKDIKLHEPLIPVVILQTYRPHQYSIIMQSVAT